MSRRSWFVALWLLAATAPPVHGANPRKLERRSAWKTLYKSNDRERFLQLKTDGKEYRLESHHPGGMHAIIPGVIGSVSPNTRTMIFKPAGKHRGARVYVAQEEASLGEVAWVLRVARN